MDYFYVFATKISVDPRDTLNLYTLLAVTRCLSFARCPTLLSQKLKTFIHYSSRPNLFLLGKTFKYISILTVRVLNRFNHTIENACVL